MQAHTAQPKRFIAYDPMTNDFEYFKTQQEALDWILDQDWSEGIPPEFSDGAYFVAEITHISAFSVTDKKENYPCLKTPAKTAHCSDCDEFKDCESEGQEWPYSRQADFVGEPYMVPIAKTTTDKAGH